MENNIGRDNSVLVLEKTIAVFAALALLSGSVSTIPKAFFWFGHITNQTLKAIINPSHIPIPIAVLLPPPDPIPSVIASCKYPFRYDNIKPDTIVAKAAHLNQNRAEGAITLLMAGFCSSGILAMLGIWTKLKYHNNPIHIIPTSTWIYLNNQLQNNKSKSKPPLRKNKPTNNNTDIASE